MSRQPRILVIDHRDSFVFILADQFLRLGARVEIYRSDLTLLELDRRIADLDPDLVVLSPGPGHPSEAETTLAWLRTRPTLPVLGVCLGHQAMALVAGARVERCFEPVHGRACQVELVHDPLFVGLQNPFPAARYHSLAVVEAPPQLRVLGTTHSADAQDSTPLIMAFRHDELPQIGLQFHPESFLTPGGGLLLANILREACATRGRSEVEIHG